MWAIALKIGLGALNIAKIVGRGIAAFFAALNVQGWIGLAATILFVVLLISQKGETRHWKKQSAGFERVYRQEVKDHQATARAFAQTVANYRAAVEEARRKDAANKARVEREQDAISERTDHDFQKRIADARDRAGRLQQHAKGAADQGGGRGAPVPGVPAPAGGPDQAAGQGRLSRSDALTATEQAIQLDELIKWVTRQHAVDVNGSSVTGDVVPERRSR